jgi:hypothetical protein
MSQQRQQFVDKPGIIAVADMGTAFQLLAGQLQNFRLLVAQGSGHGAEQEKEIIMDGVAFQEDALIGLLARGAVGKQ